MKLQPNEFGDGRVCPVCGSDNPRLVLWGDPTPETVKRAETDDNVYLGGCVVPKGYEKGPSYICRRACSAAWTVDKYGRRFLFYKPGYLDATEVRLDVVVTPDDWSTPHNVDWPKRYPRISREEWAKNHDPEIDRLFGGLSEHRDEGGDAK